MGGCDAPAGKCALVGRTIQVVSDLNVNEQLYLFERARRMKATSGPINEDTPQNAPPLCEIADADEPEQVDNQDAALYLMFVDGSTRTRESFRNAGIHNNVKVNEFQAQTSSFQKNETITDTMKMLSVYSTGRSVFVLRSPMEGVCRWLETVMGEHAEKHGIPRPAFLNAGDGRYSHPLGELVDQFSLLEKQRWDRSSIHIALVGDLLHGRTAHSKVDGLRVFRNVSVDLIAPAEFGYPVEYRNRMRANGFVVREFNSIEEYLASAGGKLASIWYFYQPQVRRWGDKEGTLAAELSKSTSFREEWRGQLPANTRFFQTLPRDKQVEPVIPLALDKTSLNSWDRHAGNAYFLHVVLLSMLFGKIGRGIPPVVEEAGLFVVPKGMKRVPSRGPGIDDMYPFRSQGETLLPSFLERVQLKEGHHRQPERARPGGPVPIEQGLVVDHIGNTSDGARCWQIMRMVRILLGWSKHIGAEGVFESRRAEGSMKGIMSLPNFDFESVTVPQMKMLASVAPGCTVNAVRCSQVVHKFRLSVPERIYNLPSICCGNNECLSSPKNKQRDVVPYFDRVPFYETSALPGCQPGTTEFLFVCKYCKWPHRYEDIWTDSTGVFRA